MPRAGCSCHTVSHLPARAQPSVPRFLLRPVHRPSTGPGGSSRCTRVCSMVAPGWYFQSFSCSCEPTEQLKIQSPRGTLAFPVGKRDSLVEVGVHTWGNGKGRPSVLSRGGRAVDGQQVLGMPDYRGTLVNAVKWAGAHGLGSSCASWVPGGRADGWLGVEAGEQLVCLEEEVENPVGSVRALGAVGWRVAVRKELCLGPSGCDPPLGKTGWEKWDSTSGHCAPCPGALVPVSLVDCALGGLRAPLCWCQRCWKCQ